jgi:acyl carrier protein
MNADEIRTALLALLHTIAPEADLESLDPAVNLREQLDLDSMDFLNFIVRVHDRLHVDIPEADYGQLATLDGMVAYLSRTVAARVAETRSHSAS